MGPGAKPGSLARRIAQAATAARYEDFAPEVAAHFKLCLLDLFGCAFEARKLPWSRNAAKLAGIEGGPATILATGQSASIPAAAFANGVAGHGLVREDMHAGAVSHLGVVVLPALLALAQRGPVTGRDFIAAGIVGYETGARIGRAIVNPEFARFFRPTGFTGPIAAAACGSRLLGLGEDACTSAIALAANTASGLNQWPHEGAEDMFFHPGFAARSGVTAVLLAELGAEGSEGALDGPAGLLTACLGGKPVPEVALFSGPPELLAVYNKPVPACNFAQTPCQAALAVVRAHGLKPSDIRAIRVTASYAAVKYPGCDYEGPFRTRLQAKMSIQFSVGAAIRYGEVAETNYERLDDPEVMRLIGLMRVDADPAFTQAFPAKQGSRVAIDTVDGRTLEQMLPDVVPATEAEIRARFRASATDAIGGARAVSIERFIDRLEDAKSAGDLPRIAAGTRAAA
ncbi:MAG TPA: MmgE/PrpD family protein [Dongiaceae bacterium]|nr:MmgE/PrpD family protein [Dongiaceae bacterium]